ncbi:lambda exonuclease family protein [Halocynthiibacter styelae]|uniref:YqaJ viral recombinase family protein n=1 Tax=Halocynthiibacter styelae TaxID=2761955 RepID=A0A8J7LPD9_9RHOB|nr:lambda exonuclease family protein [Paenihalocynthiibacter styelae]MBI1493436.1 YqaJ viral recombinase family protein [Paenihalocynthiibacter styelae]
MTEQRTDEWHTARLGKVTASKVSDVMMKPTTAGFQNYKTDLILERLTGNPTEGFTSAAMEWGTVTEPQARAFYELSTGNEVQEVGFINHPTLEMAGASPDGLVGKRGLVEIKCPNSTTHMKTLLTGKIDSKYIKQMHWQMLCTGRSWCDFVSFDPRLPAEMQIHIKRVELDAEMAQEMTAAVTSFLALVRKEMTALQTAFPQQVAA